MLLILPKVVVVVSNYYVSFDVGDLVAIDPESRAGVFEGPHSLSISTCSHLICTLLSCTSLCIWLCVFYLVFLPAVSPHHLCGGCLCVLYVLSVDVEE